MRRNIIKQLIQGVIIGFAFISGMGGGTVAVLMGIYDDLVQGVADFNKNAKASIKLLWPWVVGAVLGVGALIYPIQLAIEHFPIPTTALIVGLTIGGLRELTKITNKQVNLKNFIFAFIALVFATGIGIISWFSASSGTLSSLGITEVLIALGIGFIESAAIVAPGISGTQFLLAIGYFNAVLVLITGLFTGGNILTNLILILFIGIGFIVGVIVVSKIMKFFLTKFRIPTYFILLGFIVGSIFACFLNGDIKSAYVIFNQWDATSTWTIISSIILFAGGFILSYFLLKYIENQKNESNTKIKNEENNNGLGN